MISKNKHGGNVDYDFGYDDAAAADDDDDDFALSGNVDEGDDDDDDNDDDALSGNVGEGDGDDDDVCNGKVDECDDDDDDDGSVPIHSLIGMTITSAPDWLRHDDVIVNLAFRLMQETHDVIPEELLRINK